MGGSGFFVRRNLIATNYHVIEGAARGTAKLVGKDTTHIIEGTTAIDPINDLALLKVTVYGYKIPSTHQQRRGSSWRNDLCCRQSARA